MIGCVAGYAEHHYYLGTPERRSAEKENRLYEAKKRWVKTIRPRRKKYPMILKAPK